MTEHNVIIELNKMIAALDAKIDDMEDEAQRNALSEQLDKLYQLQGKQIAASIAQASPEYVDVAKSMNAANSELHAAFEDLAKMAKAINTVAAAVKKLTGFFS